MKTNVPDGDFSQYTLPNILVSRREILSSIAVPKKLKIFKKRFL